MASQTESSSGLHAKNLISMQDLTKDQIESIMDRSEAMLSALEKRTGLASLQNMIMVTLFFEPSTRTRLSFESAMQRLGGGVIGFADAGTSSSVKGESLQDTVKVVSSYADIMVLRHPEKGAAELAIKYSSIPVINAGDGSSQHPTQALIDLFTIKREKHRPTTMVEWPSENQVPTVSGLLPCCMSLRVVLSIATMWSASTAWRSPNTYATIARPPRIGYAFPISNDM